MRPHDLSLLHSTLGNKGTSAMHRYQKKMISYMQHLEHNIEARVPPVLRYHSVPAILTHRQLKRIAGRVHTWVLQSVRSDRHDHPLYGFLIR